jgi:diguanylate cyclase (GGDEF)-like protein
VLVAGLAAAGLFGLPTEPFPGPWVTPWWVLALLYVLAETAVIPNPIRESTHPITLLEVPLTLGLAMAAPQALVAGRLIGSGTAITARVWGRPAEVAFRLLAIAIEIVTVIWMYRLMIGSGSPVSPRGWLALIAAAVAARGIQIIAAWLRDPSKTEAADAYVIGLGAATAVMAATGLVALWYDLDVALLAGAVTVLVYATLRTFGTLRRRYTDLEIIFAFTDKLVGADSVIDSVTSVLAGIRTLLCVERAALVLAVDDAASAELLVIGAHGVLERRTIDAAALTTALESAATRREAVVLETVPSLALASRAIGLPLHSGLMTVLERGGLPIGLLVAGNRSGSEPINRHDARLFTAISRQANLALERGRLIDRLTTEVGRREHEALHDDLTGLPNRIWFTDRLTEALDTDSTSAVAILFIDLDHFKEINDTLGHDHGDRILRQVSDRLVRAVRPDDFIARLGGDEFSVLLRVGSVADAIGVARRIEEALRAPFHHEELPIEVGASIGISMDHDGGHRATTMLRHADIAMYAAKRAGTVYEIYSPEHQHFSPQRLALAGELRVAIESGAIDIHYQPQIATGDRRIVGVEALSRWHHPIRGPVPPSEFIPIAEKTGLIRPLTSHVLRTAMGAAAGWATLGRAIRLSVNISARSLTDTTIVTLIADLLRASGIAPEQLMLEITESSIMFDPTRAGDVLNRLDDLGVGISIDDFGTGYSSLAHIRELPIDEIKVDRSFVTQMDGEPGSAIIVGSTIALAHRLGLSVVGEGVETERALDVLTEAGCDLAQGFHIARPMPEASLIRWLDEHEGPVNGDNVMPLPIRDGKRAAGDG